MHRIELPNMTKKRLLLGITSRTRPIDEHILRESLVVRKETEIPLEDGLLKKTRPDKRHYSHGRLGRGSEANNRSQFKDVTDGQTDEQTNLTTYRPTSTARFRVAGLRLKRDTHLVERRRQAGK